MLDLASGSLTAFGERLGGRQKEPSFQQSVDLALTAPPTGPSVEVGSSVTVPVTVTNRGPAVAPGTVLTVDAPPGVRLEELTTPASTPVPPTRPSANWACSGPGRVWRSPPGSPE